MARESSKPSVRLGTYEETKIVELAKRNAYEVPVGAKVL